MHLPRGEFSDCAQAADPPVCEPLEARLLLSASVRRGVLTVNGTAGDDDVSIFVSRSKITVQLNRTSQSFKIAGLKYLRFNGGDGDDWFGITGKFPVLLVGGNGDDTLAGSSYADFLDGGDGNDLLDGGSGDDSIFGGSGNDGLIGRDGDDGMNGEDGDDILDGGPGADVLIGAGGCALRAGSLAERQRRYARSG